MTAPASGQRRLRVPVWALILLVVAGGATGGVASALAPRSYEATSRLYVSTTSPTLINDLDQRSTFIQQVAASYADIAISPIVLNRVIAELRLPATSHALAQQISVDNPTNTAVLGITVTDTSATRSATIANAVSLNLAKLAKSLSPSNSSKAAVKVTVIQPASPSIPAVWPRVLLATVIGAASGLAIVLLILLINTWPPTPPTGRRSLPAPPRWSGEAH
jgi:succinoglycan biosynthesis transport protein ExoP